MTKPASSSSKLEGLHPATPVDVLATTEADPERPAILRIPVAARFNPADLEPDSEIVPESVARPEIPPPPETCPSGIDPDVKPVARREAAPVSEVGPAPSLEETLRRRLAQLDRERAAILQLLDVRSHTT